MNGTDAVPEFALKELRGETCRLENCRRVLLRCEKSSFILSFCLSLWFEPRDPKFQGLVLASCGVSTARLVEMGLLPFPVGTKIPILGERFLTHNFGSFVDS